MDKKQAKKKTLEFRNEGFSVSYIAEAVGKSERTVYLYLAEDYNEKRFPELEKEIKHVLLCGNFKSFVNNLSYKDLTLINKKFELYGYNKETKIRNILNYFKHFSILGLYPEKLTRLDIKKAFRQKAKSTHPDLNPHYAKIGKEFQEVYQSYEYLMTVYV